MKLILALICGALVAGVTSAQTAADTSVIGFMAPEVRVTSFANHSQLSANDEGRGVLNGMESPLSDIGVLLQRRGLAVVNTTGAPGSSSTVRFRGMGSDHSLFCWNGIPLNAVSLGTFDVSMMPVFFTDKVLLMRDASVAELPSTGAGMTCDISSSAAGHYRSGLKVMSSVNSLGNAFYGGDLTLKIVEPLEGFGNDHAMEKTTAGDGIFLRTRFFQEDLRNNFTYKDVYQIGHPFIAQQHNNGQVRGLMQDASWLKGRHLTSFHLWYQDRELKLPSIMGKNMAGTAEQFDEVFRMMFNYVFQADRYHIGLTSSFFDEFMLYRDIPQSGDVWLIDSGIRSRVNFNTAKFQYDAHHDLMFSGNISYSNQRVLSNQYEDDITVINPVQSGISLRWKPHAHQIIADVNQDSRNMRNAPAWSISYEHMSKWQGINFKPAAAISQRFRLPDMNELFWYPGGNPSLRPERSMNYKAGFHLSNEQSKVISWNVEPACQFAMVHDWIQWIPLDGGLWSPVNYRFVRSLNFEVPIMLDYRFSRGEIGIESRYIYTKAETLLQNETQDAEFVGMIYTPDHTLYSGLNCRAGQFTFSFSHRYTSDRFTDEQNSSLRTLPAYSVVDMALSCQMQLELIVCSVSVNADNLLNVQYESVRSYAMPGRVIGATLSIEFKPIKKLK